MAEQVFCAFEAKNTLGEGPIWDAAANRLYWFDIKQALLYCGDPSNNKLHHWKLPCRASAAALRSGGGLLLATEQGLANFDPAAGDFELRWKWAHEPGFRSNDGKIDVAGRFWWGSMDDDHGRRPGELFCYTPDGRCERRADGIHIVNTVSCSPDGRTYYLADTRKREISAFDIEADGSLANRRTFVKADGNPDGSAVDAQGYLWNAHWGSWRIVRYAPDGTVDRVLELPVEQPSSCAFGGPDLTTLYITSAREYLSDEALAKQPLAGSVLAVDVGVKGLALPSFDG